MRLLLLAFSALVSVPGFCQDTAWTDPPKLVVAVVVDQMRADFIPRFWDNFGERGFKRLVNEGAYCRNTHFPYASTDTGPGHASIHTGSVPAYHGVVANNRYDRELRRKFYCVEDSTTKVVGAAMEVGGRSPDQLQASTLADELERATNGRSRTLAISLKDRAAILPIGRTGDAAYWLLENSREGFVTSTHYADVLPKWVTTFNATHPLSSYMKGTWDLLLPPDRYHSPLPDANPFERPIPGASSASLPFDLSAAWLAESGGEAFINTPGSNTILTDLALAALAGESLGSDGATDLLSISYSATDKLGHRSGPLSLEVEDMYIRLDREIARLLDGLDARVGKGAYTLFLTADHGVMDNPNYKASIGASAGYVDLRKVKATVEEFLQQAYGGGPWVLYVEDDFLILDHDLIRSNGLSVSEVQATAAMATNDIPGLLDALTGADLSEGRYLNGFRNLVANGHHPQRGADVYFLPRPGYEACFNPETATGADHGTVWTNDTHVPLLFFGKGIRPGAVVRRTFITDIAPTLSMLLAIALPDAAIGDPIPEVLK